MSKDHAMASKALALLSKQLDNSDYRNMMDAGSVSSIASYLKEHTRYGAVLEAVNEKAIHREYLEQRIRSQAQIEFASLLKYMKTDQHHFYEFFIKEMEINHIIFVLYAIEAKTKYHLGKFLMELNHLMIFDVNKLAQCTNYTEVLEVLKDTEYKNVLSMLLKDSVDLTLLEDLLWEYYNDSMLSLIKREPHHQEVMEVFKIKLELKNLALIYRLKKYYNLDAKAFSPRLYKHSFIIPSKVMKYWIDHYSAEQIVEAIKETRYGKYDVFHGDHHIEYYFSMILYKILRQKIRLAKDTDVVLFAYMNLVAFEIENIIDVIEGIRYKIPSDEIVDLLIL